MRSVTPTSSMDSWNFVLSAQIASISSRIVRGSKQALTRANAYLGLVKARAGRAPVRQPWHPWEIDPERFERERAAGITLPQTPQFAHDGFMQRGLQELNESIPDPV